MILQQSVKHGKQQFPGNLYTELSQESSVYFHQFADLWWRSFCMLSGDFQTFRHVSFALMILKNTRCNAGICSEKGPETPRTRRFSPHQAEYFTSRS
jgi:hypothetical protein